MGLESDLFFDIYFFTTDDEFVQNINLSDIGNLSQLLFEGTIYEVDAIDLTKLLTTQEWNIVRLVNSEEVEVSFSKLEEVSIVLEIFEKILKLCYSTNYLTANLMSLNLENISDSKNINLLRNRFSILEEIGVIFGLLLSAKANNYKIQFVCGAW